MQRLFSSFAGGLPGIGLLLMRSTLGIVGVSEAVSLFKHDGRMAFDAAAIVCGAAAALLVLGCLTPVAGASLGLSTAALWLAGDIASSPQGTIALFLFGNSVAIALVGPGAYSIDARLFGRREIVLDMDRPSRGPRPSS